MIVARWSSRHSCGMNVSQEKGESYGGGGGGRLFWISIVREREGEEMVGVKMDEREARVEGTELFARRLDRKLTGTGHGQAQTWGQRQGTRHPTPGVDRPVGRPPSKIQGES